MSDLDRDSGNSTDHAVYSALQGYDDDVDDELDDESLLKKSTMSVVDRDESAADAANQRLLLITFVAMVFVGFGNKVSQTFYPTALYNYPLFVNLFTTFVYIPTSFAYIIPMIKWGSAIGKEEQQIPKSKFAVMGGLDAIAGIMQALAVNYIVPYSAGLVILLSQASVPVSMLISKLLVKDTKYTLAHYSGATVVLGGVGIALIPVLTKDNSDDESDTSYLLLWCMVMILSNIPMTLSSVFKEMAMGDTVIDPVYLNGWVAVFQFLVSLPMLIPSAPTVGLPIKDIGHNLWHGWLCFATGENFITCDDGDTACHPDKCSNAALLLGIYLVFNVGYNLLIVLMLKYGTSNLLWLAMTIMVPMGNIAFALPFMINYQPMQATDILGLIAICFGLFIYRFWTKAYKRMRMNCCPDEFTVNGKRTAGAMDSPFLFPAGKGEKPSHQSPAGGTPARGLDSKHTSRGYGRSDEPVKSTMGQKGGPSSRSQTSRRRSFDDA